jgi:hypothetical protein
MNALKKEIVRLSNSLIDEKKKEPNRGEFENHTKGFGSSYMKKFGFADGKGLGKQEQDTKDLIPFIKNYHTKGVGTRNVVHRMKQLGAKNFDRPPGATDRPLKRTKPPAPTQEKRTVREDRADRPRGPQTVRY